MYISQEKRKIINLKCKDVLTWVLKIITNFAQLSFIKETVTIPIIDCRFVICMICKPVTTVMHFQVKFVVQFYFTRFK